MLDSHIEEVGVLSCMLHDYHEISDKLHDIEDYHFESSKHRIIFNGIYQLILKNEKPELIKLVNQLKDIGKLAKAGGADYVSGIFDERALGLIDYNVGRVIELYKKRAILAALNPIFYKPDEYTSDEMQELVLSKFIKLESEDKTGFITWEDGYEKYQKQKNKKVRSIHTGLSLFDETTGGLKEGEFWIIGARTGHGKTSFGLEIARLLAGKSVPIGIVSLEMSFGELADRIIQQSDSDLDASLPICIDDSYDSSIDKIISRAQVLVKRKNIKVLIVDYIQLLKGAKSENRHNEIAEISRSLKLFAGKHKLAIIAMSQVNRTASGEKPFPQHLKDSGALEQDADKIITLWRPELDNIQRLKDGSSSFNKCLVNVVKNRQGRLNDILFEFIPSRTKFREKELYNQALKQAV